MRVLVTLAALVAMWQASASGQQAPNPVIPPAGTVVHRDIAYVTDGHDRHQVATSYRDGGRRTCAVARWQFAPHLRRTLAIRVLG